MNSVSSAFPRQEIIDEGRLTGISLTSLLTALPHKRVTEGKGKSRQVYGISCHSTSVRAGDLFVAIKGFRFDGHRFLEEAFHRGAVGVVVERPVTVPKGAVRVLVRDSREALAHLSSRFFGEPSKCLQVIGVTGTNGKTTTCFLVDHILRSSGFQTSLFGTVENHIAGKAFHANLTTMESCDLQKFFYESLENQVRVVVMEVSSHALSLSRVHGVHFDVGVLTNLTQDHLDFHGNLEDYYHAKRKLFLESPRGSEKPFTGVINLDSTWGKRLLSEISGKALTYGVREKADILAQEVKMMASGSEFKIMFESKSFPVRLNLPGLFNVYNALAAFGAVKCLNAGVSLEQAAGALSQAGGAPGRMESVAPDASFLVLVDYAHTPDGLENVLLAARELTDGKVILVFGCGGDRDRGKRKRMGEIAARLADFSVITSDNPRSEEPQFIIDEILKGFMSARHGRYEIEADRKKAIERALQKAVEGDVVLIAGKGHETYQIFKDKTIHFDDREIVREIIGAGQKGHEV